MSPLESFYKNSTILITGGNGFLGKVLVEKLLRCFDVNRIYLLIRSKDDENVERRIEKFTSEPVKMRKILLTFLFLSSAPHSSCFIVNV